MSENQIVLISAYTDLNAWLDKAVIIVPSAWNLSLGLTSIKSSNSESTNLLWKEYHLRDDANKINKPWKREVGLNVIITHCEQFFAQNLITMILK